MPARLESLQTGQPVKVDVGQRGAVLVAALALLLVLTVLAASVMVTATLELTMTGNAQAAVLAFQAAETGIEVAIAGRFDTDLVTTYTGTAGAGGSDAFSATVTCVGVSPLPDGMYSEAVGARAIHFEIESTGTGPRNAVAIHRQGVYVVGPRAPYSTLDPADSAEGC